MSLHDEELLRKSEVDDRLDEIRPTSKPRVGKTDRVVGGSVVGESLSTDPEVGSAAN
jgi:hypothetical protein